MLKLFSTFLFKAPISRRMSSGTNRFCRATRIDALLEALMWLFQINRNLPFS